MNLPYADRRQAGAFLAAHLLNYRNRPGVIVYALPRGGVPVAYEVALQLSAPLDVFVVRKLGAPGREELAIGAIASGGQVVLNHEEIRELRITGEQLSQVASREQAELTRREELYRGSRPVLDPGGKTVLLIDDGLATGATMRAAARAIRQANPARLVLAVPVAPPSTCAELQDEADEVVCAATPKPFQAVGLWYEDFSETTDEEVRALLAAARSFAPAWALHQTQPGSERVGPSTGRGL